LQKQDINKTQTDIIEPIYCYKWPKNQGDFIFAIFTRPKPKDKNGIENRPKSANKSSQAE